MTDTKKAALCARQERQYKGYITHFIIPGFALFASLIPSAAMADGPELTPPPAVVDMQMLPTPTPSTAPTPLPVEIREYDLDQNDVDTLSRLLWSSPLRSETYKRQLIEVVLNRIDAKMTGSTIADTVILSEFTFFDKTAHLSEENERIVRDELNRWYSAADGLHAGRSIPKTYLYIRFVGDGNRILEVTEEKGGVAYEG